MAASITSVNPLMMRRQSVTLATGDDAIRA
jgi:hypothetical protein